MRNRRRRVILGLVLVAAAVALIAPFIGMERIAPSEVLRPAQGSVEPAIFWQIRVPRVATAFVAGAVLAVCGMAFQAMFRNPLATPFTLGVSSGASLGAAIYVRLGIYFSVFGIGGASVAAFIGAFAAMTTVYGLTRARGGFSSTTLLLAGVAMSFFFSSLILAIQYTASLHDSFRLIRWMMGGLAMVGYGSLLNMLPFALPGVAILAFMTQELNLIATGEDLAASRGVDVARTKQVLFFAVTLAVGGVVAICGPIGFVGMMAPHMCRLMIGEDHRALFPATLLFGGAFLTVCDAVGRTVAAPAEAPVGVITALIGGPFFLWLLFRRGDIGIG